MSKFVWEISEIEACPESGNWLYGFARVDGKLVFGEIFPRYGVAVAAPYPLWSPKAWYWAVRDVLAARWRVRS